MTHKISRGNFPAEKLCFLRSGLGRGGVGITRPLYVVVVVVVEMHE